MSDNRMPELTLAPDTAAAAEDLLELGYALW